MSMSGIPVASEIESHRQAGVHVPNQPSAPPFTTQSSNLNGARSLSTVYQNTSGKAMAVLVSVTDVTTSNIRSYVDSVIGCTNQIGMQYFPNNSTAMVTFIVPPNFYYKITSGSGASAISYWFEVT